MESSCEDVSFEAQIVVTPGAGECEDGQSAVDVQNLGNIPIYGIKLLKYDSVAGSIDPTFDEDQPFHSAGTLTAGKSDYVCIPGATVGETYRVIPKLLAEKEERTISYTCPEKDGITINAV